MSWFCCLEIDSKRNGTRRKNLSKLYANQVFIYINPNKNILYWNPQIFSVKREALQYIEVNMDETIDYSPRSLKTDIIPKTYIPYRDHSSEMNIRQLMSQVIDPRYQHHETGEPTTVMNHLTASHDSVDNTSHVSVATPNLQQIISSTTLSCYSQFNVHVRSQVVPIFVLIGYETKSRQIWFETILKIFFFIYFSRTNPTW